MKSIPVWNKNLLYKDTFSLFPSYWETGGDTEVFIQESIPAIVDAPCYLSRGKNSLGSSNRMDQPKKNSDTANGEERVLLMFCDLEHKISIGDALRIHHMGEVFDVVAGAPHKYPLFQELLVYCQRDA